MPEPRTNGCALVTGASRGIGAAIARAISEDGWAVGVNFRSDATGADAVVHSIEAGGGRAVALQGDVTDPTAPDRLFELLESTYGCPVLVLVNNAGGSSDDLTPAMSDEAWSSVIDTDLPAAFRFTRRALKPMMRARSGRIVNVSSVVGLRANPGQGDQPAPKAGLIAFTRNAAVEVARRGITINAVAPGWIDTDMTADVSKELLAQVPARRAGTPGEGAAGGRFLASDQAGYVTGAVLSVDGGLAA